MRTRSVRILLIPIIMLTLQTSISMPTSENLLAPLQEANVNMRRFVLKNGMVCLIKEDHSAPLAAIQCWVGTGSIHEDEYLGAGLSHYVEHMIFKGTSTRKANDITRDINDAGGMINAYTTHDRTVFYTVIPSARWRVGFDVISDAMMNATFPKKEWEREKDVVTREMSMGRDDPYRVSSKLLYRNAYRVHPLKHPVIGYEDVLNTITHEDLLGFFERHYEPNNMILAMTGDFDSEEVENTIRKTFTSFHRRARPPVVLPEEPPQLTPRFERKTGAYHVSRLHWAYHTVSLDHPDAPALDVLAVILGQGRSARLVQHMKEGQKIVYHIDAWSSTPKEPGLFGISATFEPDKEKEVIASIQQLIHQWKEEPFTAAEIEKAKRAFLVGGLSELQTIRGQASSLASDEFYAGDPNFSIRYLEKINQVTAQDLEKVIRHYFYKDNRTLVILSPDTNTEKPPKTATETSIPTAKKIELPNQIPLLVRESHRLPFVYFSIALRGGLLSENKENQGITQLMTELLIRGTRTQSSEEIAEKVESVGASISSFAGPNSFGVAGKCLSQDKELLANLLTDCLINPSFSDEEIKKQKRVQSSAIQQQKERPMFLAQQKLRNTLFPDHPYQWTPLGTAKTLQEITQKNIIDHYKRLLTSKNMVISIFGDLSEAKAKMLGERIVTQVPTGPAPTLKRTLQKQPTLPTKMEQHAPKEQAIFLAGYPSVTVNDPRADGLEIIQTALSGLSSSLGIEIREKRGLVYYVGAYQHIGLDPGMFVFYAGTQEESIPEVDTLIQEEVERIFETGLTEEELDRAKEQIIGNYYNQLQNNGSLAQTCALHELYGLGYNHIFSTEERIRSYTKKDIQKIAASVFSKNRRAISIVTPETTKKGATP
ncbi:MAG: hypothetical protein GKR87_07950 [Kiritimatiellae bacterium]|nr:hypothetical protein [Kiritimatiellia bacterium]